MVSEIEAIVTFVSLKIAEKICRFSSSVVAAAAAPELRAIGAVARQLQSLSSQEQEQEQELEQQQQQFRWATILCAGPRCSRARVGRSVGSGPVRERVSAERKTTAH